MFEQLDRIALVNLHPRLEYLAIHVVSPFFNDRTPLNPLDQLIDVFDHQDNDPFDLDVPVQKIRLPYRTGYAVQKEKLLGGEIAVCRDQSMDKVVPNLDGHLIG